jgi:putative tryptophan/tyrosine transport system substrate-binding protein
MRRREFITLLGGAAAWPLVARAQQPAMPAIGFLRHTYASDSNHLVTAFKEGLSKRGFLDGKNVSVEYRWAENNHGRLSALAADLVRRRVAVIFAGGNDPALAAKAATTAIPIVFAVRNDPVQLGLVERMNRPGGNLTGVSFLSNSIAAKRLGLLHDLAPQVSDIGFLLDPSSNPTQETEAERAAVQGAAQMLSERLVVVEASNDAEIEIAFQNLAREHIGALLVGSGAFFNSRRDRLAMLAARYRIPASYLSREFAVAGGLMSYGASLADSYRQAGIYAGRIIEGERPADLPVMLPVKFDLVINLTTAKALSLTIPPTLLAIADEVIE